MSGFAWALIAFVAIHVGVSATGLRARLAGAIGEGPYRALFSLVSLGLLIWLIQGYGAMRADPFDPLNEPLWLPPSWLRWPAIVLGLFSIALAVTGLLTPGPTLAGFEALSDTGTNHRGDRRRASEADGGPATAPVPGQGI